MWLLIVGLMMLSLQRFADARTIRHVGPEEETGKSESTENHFRQTTQSIGHEPDFVSTEVPSILLPDPEEAGPMTLARFSKRKSYRKMPEQWKDLLKKLHLAVEEDEEEVKKDTAEEDGAGSGEGSVEKGRKVKRDAEKKEEIANEKKSEMSLVAKEKVIKKMAAEDKEKDKRSNQDEKDRRDAATAEDDASAAAEAAAAEAEENAGEEEEEEEEEEQKEEEKKEEEKKEKTDVEEKKKRHYNYKDAGMDESDFDKDQEFKVKREDDDDQHKEKKRAMDAKATRQKSDKEEEEEEDIEEEEEEEEEEEQKLAARKQRRHSKEKGNNAGRAQRTPSEDDTKYRHRLQQSMADASRDKYLSSSADYRRSQRGAKAFNKASDDYRRRVYRDHSDEENYRQRRHRLEDDNRRRFWRHADDNRNYGEDVNFLRDVRHAEAPDYYKDEVMRAVRHADVNAAKNYDTIRNLRKAVDYGKSREDERLARDSDREKRSDYDYRKIRHAYGNEKTGEAEEFRRSDARRIRHANDEDKSVEYEARKMRHTNDDRKRFNNRLRSVRYAGDAIGEDDESRERRLADEGDRMEEDEGRQRRNTEDDEEDAGERRQLRQAELDSKRTSEEKGERRVRLADAEGKLNEYERRRIRNLDNNKMGDSDYDSDEERNMRYAEDDARNVDIEKERKMRQSDDGDDGKVEARRRRLVEGDSKRRAENEVNENEHKLMNTADEIDLAEDRSQVKKRWVARREWDSDLPQGKRSTDEKTDGKKARSRRGSAVYGLLLSGLVPRLARIRQRPISIKDDKHPASENTAGKVVSETGEISSERIMSGTGAENISEIVMPPNEKYVHVSAYENPEDLNVTESENYKKAEGKAYDLKSPMIASEDQGKSLQKKIGKSLKEEMPVHNNPSSQNRVTTVPKLCPKGDCSTVHPEPSTVPPKSRGPAVSNLETKQ